MSMIREIQAVRTQLIRNIDTTFDQLIRRLNRSGELTSDEGADEKKSSEDHYESVYPLTAVPAISKGKKPTGVLFGQKDRENVYTWKMAVQSILQRCNADPEKHVALMNLRNKVSGRSRMLLTKEPKEMRSPLMIDQNLYVETHYDSETLLRILMTRILDAVEYDYGDILITIRNSR